jgi:hypothetical protein
LMQKNRDDYKPGRVVHPDQWGSLPVQPPAGYWWRMTRRLSVVLLSTVGMLAILAVASVTVARAPAWLVSAVLAMVVLLGVAIIAICVIAARPYRAERRLGYTTWPSGKELGNGR